MAVRRKDDFHLCQAPTQHGAHSMASNVLHIIDTDTSCSPNNSFCDYEQLELNNSNVNDPHDNSSVGAFVKKRTELLYHQQTKSSDNLKNSAVLSKSLSAELPFYNISHTRVFDINLIFNTCSSKGLRGKKEVPSGRACLLSVLLLLNCLLSGPISLVAGATVRSQNNYLSIAPVLVHTSPNTESVIEFLSQITSYNTSANSDTISYPVTQPPGNNFPNSTSSNEIISHENSKHYTIDNITPTTATVSIAKNSDDRHTSKTSSSVLSRVPRQAVHQVSASSHPTSAFSKPASAVTNNSTETPDFCHISNIKCGLRKGCGMALQRYMLDCSDLINGYSQDCSRECQDSLLILTSTPEGRALTECECSDGFCHETKQRLEVCRSGLVSLVAGGRYSCSQAHSLCSADVRCATAISYYDTFCRRMFNGRRCSPRCNNSIAILQRQEMAAPLETCECDGTEPFPCADIKSNMARLCFHSTNEEEREKEEEETNEIDTSRRTKDTTSGAWVVQSWPGPVQGLGQVALLLVSGVILYR